MIRGLFYTLLFLLTTQVEANTNVQNSIINTLTNEMCNSRIVLLGENNHGDGNSPAFKTALTKRLIDECGFDNLVFEASFYDSMAIMQKVRQQNPVTSDMIKSAMGSIRYNTKGIAPLIPFVTERVKSGALTISGMDDQISIVGSFYTLGDMSADFANYLQGEREGECASILYKRLWYRYDDNAPYNEAEKERVLECLSEIKTATKSKAKTANRAKTTATDAPAQTNKEFYIMAATMERAVIRDFTDTGTLRFKRDKSMFTTLDWLINEARKNAKFIVWSVNAHAAKSTDGFQNFRGGKNLGAYMREKYGNDIYALAFTAAGGTYKFGRTVKSIPKATDSSLEALALKDTAANTVFLNHEALMKLRKVTSNIDNNNPVTSDWSKAFDGVVIFREGKSTQLVE